MSLKHSLPRFLVLCGVFTLALGAGVVAGRTFFSKSVDPAPEAASEVLVATAQNGTLGESYLVPVNVNWRPSFAYEYLGDPGLVTGLVDGSGDYLARSSGDVLLFVDGEPVLVATGDQPAYRTLEAGVRGADVLQLQALLVDQGLLSQDDADGVFGNATGRAVEKLWDAVGVSRRRSVPLGSLLFVPALPRPLSVPTDVQVGTRLQTGETVLSALDPEPHFEASLTTVQEQRLAEQDAYFAIKFDTGRIVKFVAAGTTTDDSGSTVTALMAEESESGRFVSEFAVGVQARVTAELIITEPTSGTLIPLASLVHGGDDDSDEVITASGERRRVDVIAVVGGEVVVDGVSPGEDVRVQP